MDGLTNVMVTLEDSAENDYEELEGAYSLYRQGVRNGLSDDALLDLFLDMVHQRVVTNDALTYMAHHADDGVCNLARELSVKVNHLDSDERIGFGYLLGADGPTTLIVNDLVTPTKMIIDLTSGPSAVQLEGLNVPADVVVKKWTEEVATPLNVEVMDILRQVGDKKFSNGMTRHLSGVEALDEEKDKEEKEITDIRDL